MSLSDRVRAHPRAVALAVAALLVANSLLLASDRGHDPTLERTLPGDAQPVVAAAGKVATLVRQGAFDHFVLVAAGATSDVDRFPADSVMLAGAHSAYAIVAYADGASRAVHSLGREFVTEGRARGLAVGAQAAAVAFDDGRVVLLRDGNTTVVNAGATVTAMAFGDEPGPRPAFAYGTDRGRIEFWRAGSANEERRSVRVDATIMHLALAQGGRWLLAGTLGADNAAHLFDLDDPAFGTPRWQHRTAHGATLVFLSRDGERAFVFTETPGRGLVQVLAVDDGALRWSHAASGTVARLENGQGGVAVNADGTRVAVVSLSGDLVVLDGISGSELSRTALRGATSLAFDGAVLAANGRWFGDPGYVRVLTVSDKEPLLRNAALTVPAANVTILAMLALYLLGRKGS
ncbi:MAG TPA: hypothetical protein VM681_00340 [Candidatus Thermoplasmatota archaeon]|nr:hypothetical protein [Candidatus Thermoplasmatota archaeon]